MSQSDDPAVFIITPPDNLSKEPAYAHKFYEAIGRFVVKWGSMETHLEALLRMAINIEGRSEPERTFQINLGRKIDLLKDICRDCPALKHFEAAIRGMSATIKEWGQDRDFLVHSILIGFEDGPPAKIVLRHVEHPKGTMIRVERGVFSLEQIAGFTEQTKQLHRALIPLIQQMTELQDPQKLERARSLAGQAAQKKAPIQL